MAGHTFNNWIPSGIIFIREFASSDSFRFTETTSNVRGFAGCVAACRNALINERWGWPNVIGAAIAMMLVTRSRGLRPKFSLCTCLPIIVANLIG
jgi:hypothetical protein